MSHKSLSLLISRKFYCDKIMQLWFEIEFFFYGFFNYKLINSYSFLCLKLDPLFFFLLKKIQEEGSQHSPHTHKIYL